MISSLKQKLYEDVEVPSNLGQMAIHAIKQISRETGKKFAGNTKVADEVKSADGMFYGIKFLSSDGTSIRFNFRPGSKTFLSVSIFHNYSPQPSEEVTVQDIKKAEELSQLISEHLLGKKEESFREQEKNWAKELLNGYEEYKGFRYRSVKTKSKTGEIANKIIFSDGEYNNGKPAFADSVNEAKVRIDDLAKGEHDPLSKPGIIQRLFKKAPNEIPIVQNKAATLVDDIEYEPLTGQEIFDRVNVYIDAIVDDKSGDNLLIVGGDPGIGKSKTIETALEKECGAEKTPSFKRITYDDLKATNAAALKADKAAKAAAKKKAKPAAKAKSEKPKLEPVVPITQAEIDKPAEQMAEDAPVDPTNPEVAMTLTQKLNTISEMKIPFRKEWVRGSAKINALQLYVEMFSSNGRILVYDDSDSVITDKACVGLLKLALDTKPVRKISFGSKTNFIDLGKDIGFIPKWFNYTGKVIVITNKYFSKIDDAILSRALAVEVDLTPKQILERLQNILPSIQKIEAPQIPIEIFEKVYQWVYELMVKRKALKKFDYRTYLALVKDMYRQPNFAVWQKYAFAAIKVKYPVSKIQIKAPTE